MNLTRCSDSGAIVSSDFDTQSHRRNCRAGARPAFFTEGRCKISHVDAYQCEFTSLALLDAAVKQVGGAMRQSERFVWYSHHVGDHPLPKGYSVADMGKCKYAIKFDGIAYEIGVVPSKTKPGTWDLLADFWGPGESLPEKIRQIKVEYAAQAALAWAKSRGYTNVRISRANGGAQILVEQ